MKNFINILKPHASSILFLLFLFSFTFLDESTTQTITNLFSNNIVFFLLIGVLGVYFYYRHHKRTDPVRLFIDKNISTLGKEATIAKLLEKGYPRDYIEAEITKQQREDMDVIADLKNNKLTNRRLIIVISIFIIWAVYFVLF